MKQLNFKDVQITNEKLQAVEPEVLSSVPILCYQTAIWCATQRAFTGEQMAIAKKEWMEAKGIAGNPWAITKKIHKEGTNLYRQGGRTDIVQPAVDTFINNVSQRLLDQAADDFQIKIREWYQ